MKNKKNIVRNWMLMMFVALVSLVAMAFNVSAATLGEGISIFGYNGGWFIVVVGIIVAVVAFAWKTSGNSSKLPAYIVALLLIIAGGFIAIADFEEAPAADTTGDNCCDFELTGTAITAGAVFVDSTWNENTNTLTVPLTVADSSDGNLTGYAAGVNVTLEALGLTNDVNCVFTVTSDYTMTYGGETVLDKTGDDYRAEITTASGTEYVTDVVQVAAGSTAYINCSWYFINGTSGSWVTELSQVGDSLTWYVTFENSCGDKETITVHAIVVSYTA